jgi:hypothetical protein
MIFLYFLFITSNAQAKFMNLRFDVGSIIFSGTDVGILLNLGEKVGIGGSYTSFDATVATSKAEATGYSANLAYFFNGFSTDSWFFEAQYSLFDAKSSLAGVTILESTGNRISVVIAKQWMWSYFNQQLGIGYGTTTVKSSSSLFSSLGGGGIKILWNIGFAF